MTLYDKTKIFLFQIPFGCFPVATCCSRKKRFSCLTMQQHTGQQSSSAGVAVNSSKDFLIALICAFSKDFLIALICAALHKFVFGIVTSVSKFAIFQLTHSFVKRESQVDTEVERNLSCRKLLLMSSDYLRAHERTEDLLIRSLCSAFITLSLFTKHVDSANLQLYVEQCCNH